MNLIIKGFIIGIGKIIPGVSGSMLAITLGIYERIVESISNLRRDIKTNMYFLTKIAIGIIIAITLTSKIIVKSLKQHYFPTMLLFIGMIIGGTPKIIKEINLKKREIIKSLIIILPAIIVILSKKTSIITTHQLEYTLKEIIKIFLIGTIDAAASIIPGISGTALLIMTGYYNIILETFATISEKEYITKNIFVIIPFISGFTIGIIFISKILNKLIKKKKNILNITIIILMIISVLSILQTTFVSKYNKIEFTIGLVNLIIGIIIANKLEKMNN